MAWQPDYATDAELAAFMRIGHSDDDAQLALAVSAASRAVDRHTFRQFGKTDAAEERKYTPVWDRRRARWVVTIDDLMTQPDTVEVTAGTITEFTLEPVNAAANGKPWTLLVVDPDSAVKPAGTEHEAAITADPWGWSSTPTPVKQATLLQGSRIMARRDSPFGVAGSPELGSELRLLARVDPDVAVVLGPYVRWWGAA